MDYREPTEKEHEIVLKHASRVRFGKIIGFAIGGFLLAVTVTAGVLLIVFDKWHGYLLFPFATFILFLFFSDVKGWDSLYKAVRARDYKVNPCVVKDKHVSAGSTHNVSNYVTIAFDNGKELNWKVTRDLYKKAAEGAEALMVDYKDPRSRKGGRTKELVL